MADTFGITPSSRLTDGSKFYATPAVNVAANTIFMPAYSTSPLFGVAEYPVTAGELGAFSTDGVFAFNLGEGVSATIGSPIFYSPTSAVAGTFSTSSSEGAVLIGFCVNAPGLGAGLTAVKLINPLALEAGSGSGSGS